MPEAKAFVIVQIVINNPDGYRQYGLADHLEIFDKFGAKVVGCSDPQVQLSETWSGHIEPS